ncbi:MAG: hypothetical protein R3293_19505 [Candidatus Promineifilaceae bacterium]|nr:hypothetical protein [Candidatus Promineifilaceae bacterium]
MNLRNLFRVSGVLFLIFGVSWLVAPKAMPAAFGVDIDSYTAYLLQQLGAINVASAVLCFLVSGMAHSPARQAVVTFFLVEQVLAGIVSLLGVLGGAVPSPGGWISVVFNLILALAFGYCRFVRTEAGVATELQT